MERVNIKQASFSFDYNKLSTRKVTDIIVLHHTGNPTDDDLSAKQINSSHQSQGWTCIGYHYVIRKDGTIEEGRPHWTVGAHAYGENSHSIGIHLCGNFEIGKPTDAQIEAVAMLLANITADYGLPADDKHIVGHRDLIATACPGKNCYSLMRTIIGKANWYRNAEQEKLRKSKYFADGEIECHGYTRGKGCCDGGVSKVSNRLLTLLDHLRENIGSPVCLSCAYRCPRHNADVGGVSNSQHVAGTAADVIKPDHLTFGEFKWYIEQLPFDGIGLYPSQEFIHVDVRNGGIGSKIYWYD